MHIRPAVRRLLPAALLTGLVLVAGTLAPSAAAAPATPSPSGAALSDPSRPTADPGAPTPTAPLTRLPPQGTAPDGSIVGGGDLSTRRVVVAPGAPRLPSGIGAGAWLVADATTGDVLAARDPHGRYYPASTLKTLTLLTLVPVLDPHEVVVGTAQDEQIEGSRVGLVAGGRYSVQLLFQALILQSGNDAANALARAYGGVTKTVDAMNQTAERLGAYDTVAGTPSGLDVAGQATSPYDLALIFRALLENPRTAAILRVPTATMPPVPGKFHGFQIQSQNPLLSSYPGDLGGKTGFTDAARHTFVTAASRGGRTLVVSLMNSENRPMRPADQAARLLDWGFAVRGAEPIGRLVRPEDLTATPSATVTPPGGPANVATAAVGAPWAPTAHGAGSTSLVPAVLGLAGLLALAVAGGSVTLRRRARRPGRGGPPASPGPP